MNNVRLDCNLKDEFLNDEELITIFEIYHKKIYSYIHYRVGNHAVAQDLTSEVFEKVITYRRSYSRKKGSIEVWLFTIAKNNILNYFRDQKRHSWMSLETVLEIFSSKRTPEDVTLEHENNTELYKALRILNERERNIIALKFGSNLTNIKIAEIMNLSESNVGSILYRTMKKLKKEMEQEGVICLKNA